MVNDRDAFFMRKALQLAERGRGTTSPNPMVGALVVDNDGVIVGRGAHEFAGGAHAEVHALRDARERARGATLYCTLEPCCHVGRTGPCAPAVADAGIARVVIASEDPNPVAGGGTALLRSRGIAVTTGILDREARHLNAPFFTTVTRQRPFVTMKVAVSLDGGIAAAPGERTALTGASANRLVHRERAEVDAIAIGVGTMLADDPLLTARGAFRRRPLTRIVYDRGLRTPPAARIFSTLDAGPVIIVCAAASLTHAQDRAARLRSAGAEILVVEDAGTPGPSLRALAAREVTSLVVEGGARLHAAFWDAEAVDRVQIYVTPHQLGEGAVKWLDAPVMSSPRIRQRGALPLEAGDVLLEGYVHGFD
jgi:diaminohydroxyphosphoribosylaminopyrimidine deaminase / 5-amino-6-(5-phosphoribosylamino)uracil reductase